MAEMGQIAEPLVSYALLVGRICLATVFLVSGVHKLFWYGKAMAEFEQARVPLIRLTLPLTILLHLVAPLFLIIGRYTTEAALALAVFTVISTLWVHSFWRMSGEEKLARSRIALAHLAIVGGLLLLAVTGPGGLS